MTTQNHHGDRQTSTDQTNGNQNTTATTSTAPGKYQGFDAETLSKIAESQSRQIANQTATIESKDRVIENLRATIAYQDQSIEILNSRVQDLNGIITELRATISETRDLNARLNKCHRKERLNRQTKALRRTKRDHHARRASAIFFSGSIPMED